MSKQNPVLKATIAGILAVGGSGASTGVHAAVPDQPKNWEKCAGIAKTGMNDCGAMGGSHSCAGQAKFDNADHEWVCEVFDRLHLSSIETRRSARSGSCPATPGCRIQSLRAWTCCQGGAATIACTRVTPPDPPRHARGAAEAGGIPVKGGRG